MVNGTYCHRSDVWQYSHKPDARCRIKFRIEDRILSPDATMILPFFQIAVNSEQRDL